MRKFVGGRHTGAVRLLLLTGFNRALTRAHPHLTVHNTYAPPPYPSPAITLPTSPAVAKNAATNVAIAERFTKAGVPMGAGQVLALSSTREVLGEMAAEIEAAIDVGDEDAAEEARDRVRALLVVATAASAKGGEFLRWLRRAGMHLWWRARVGRKRRRQLDFLPSHAEYSLPHSPFL
jgi:hypothetical protein